jgi:hypothetical protein
VVTTPNAPSPDNNPPRPSARFLVGNGCMAEAVRSFACTSTQPLIVLTLRAVAALGEELGGREAAAGWLVELATETNRPIAVNVPAPDGGSVTHFYAPSYWSQEKLMGYAAGFSAELEAEFGEIARLQAGGTS